jgi:hypothetical protein
MRSYRRVARTIALRSSKSASARSIEGRGPPRAVAAVRRGGDQSQFAVDGLPVAHGANRIDWSEPRKSPVEFGAIRPDDIADYLRPVSRIHVVAAYVWP